MQSYDDFRLSTTFLLFFALSLCDKCRFSTTVIFCLSESVVWAKKKLPAGKLFLVYKRVCVV